MVGPKLGVAVERERVVAVATRRGRPIWAAEARYQGVDDLRQVLTALAAERPRGARRAAAVLMGDLARAKQVDGIPKLSRAELREHVRLNVRRYFLQNGVPMLTDACLVRAAGGGPPRALLVGAIAPLVEAVHGGLAAAGLDCSAIVPVSLLGGEPDAAAAAETVVSRGRFDAMLLPGAARERESRHARRTTALWLVGAIAALLLVVVASFGAVVRRGRLAERELESLAPAVAQALSARRDLDAAESALAWLRAAEQRGVRATETIARITAALPDSAVLVSLQLAAGQGRVSGYAASAATLLPRLSRLTGLSARFEGPVARENFAGREWERFTAAWGRR